MISESIGCKKKKLSKSEVFHLQQKCEGSIGLMSKSVQDPW